MPRVSSAPTRATTPAEIPLRVCGVCDGQGFMDGWPRGEPPFLCLACEGGKFACVAGDLGPSRSQKTRAFLFNPGLRRLWLTKRDGHQERYDIREFMADPDEFGPCRGFQCLRLSEGILYHLSVGANDRVTCDCMGALSDSSAKANYRAALANRPVVNAEGQGCSHGDFLDLAVKAGLMEVR